MGERDKHRLLNAKAFERALGAAIDWTVKVVDIENKEGENLWVLQKLPEEWSNELGASLLRRIKQGKLKPQCFDQLLTALVERNVPNSLDFARSKLPKKVPAAPKLCQLARYAAGLIMVQGESGDWPRVWNLVRENDDFGKGLVETFAHDYSHAPSRILRILSESDISALWEWMLTQYPVATDPDRSRGGTVTTRHAMADLRDSLVSHLADTGTVKSCAELQRLIDRYPQFKWFGRVLLRGQEQMRRLTWRPTSPNQLLQLAVNRRARLVQSGSQLLEVIMDSMTTLQERLQAETPLAQFLWDGKKPKPEEAISEWVKVHLEDDLKRRGVVLGREVQIHRFDRTDIHVTAVTPRGRDDAFGNVKVIIEVKGAWHRELKSAMKKQLLDRYLKNNDCRHGLYVVGWFELGAWDKNDERRKQVRFPTRSVMENWLANQAMELSNAAKSINALVIDFSLRGPTAKPRASKRRKQRSTGQAYPTAKSQRKARRK